MGYLFWLSLKVIPATFGVTTPVLEISYLYIHLVFPIFTGLMLLYLIGRIFQMGWRHLAFSCLVSMAFLAALYLIFGIKTYSGPALVVISLACTGLLITFSMPIVFALGIGCALFLVLFKDYPHQIMHTRMVGGIDSFPLLAVPFFILAGELLNTGGVTTRLVALAKVFSRFYPWWPGDGHSTWRIFFLWNFRLNSGRCVCHRIHHGPGIEKGRL